MYQVSEVFIDDVSGQRNIRHGCVWSGKCLLGKYQSRKCLRGMQCLVGKCQSGKFPLGICLERQMPIRDESGQGSDH